MCGDERLLPTAGRCRCWSMPDLPPSSRIGATETCLPAPLLEYFASCDNAYLSPWDQGIEKAALAISQLRSSPRLRGKSSGSHLRDNPAKGRIHRYTLSLHSCSANVRHAHPTGAGLRPAVPLLPRLVRAYRYQLDVEVMVETLKLTLF
ncbi:hypothetical protein Purlil1_12912 [Purpureocillium lilacinum]|uniref:Uncharacterized protein n=1 Tax=Purpureocillium lilacinum TaxID=33203 RepID=A0ABR0BFS5_PURLI|nr:hypothetical protein Purlil1_12912 [Purpureocillium lilacinum]